MVSHKSLKEMWLWGWCVGGDANLCADMKQHFVIDPLISKRQQLLLATQLCRMVLKVNNVIIAGSEENEF